MYGFQCFISECSRVKQDDKATSNILMAASAKTGCTVLCKKNANEFRRNSAIVLPKIRRYFERNFVIFSDENSNGFSKTARKLECIPEISLIQERNFV